MRRTLNRRRVAIRAFLAQIDEIRQICNRLNLVKQWLFLIAACSQICEQIFVWQVEMIFNCTLARAPNDDDIFNARVN